MHFTEQLLARMTNFERLKRRIESGLEDGTVLENGVVTQRSPKGYTPYTTRELITRVRTIMDRNEAAGRGRTCPINGRWQLQIRGKDLRRLKKAMPGLRQVGRSLVETRA